MTIYFDKLDNDLSSASVPCGIIDVEDSGGIYRNFVKRALDVALIVVAAPIVLPAVGLIALMVARDGNSPFYWNTRVGRRGVEFEMLKLRTMVPNADQMLEDHLASDEAANSEWQSSQKLKNDPRITALGRVLRKVSLDELPQLWNVLIGDMSLVGPRPMMSSQRAIYSGLSYYSLRPGVTGPWQVSDRNDCEFAKRAKFDKEYDGSLSFMNDLRLLLKTVGVVFRGTGY